MNQNVFKRIEEKYLLSKKDKNLLLKSISKHLEKDEYFESTICNIYFDSENNDLIINSIEKPVYKDKVRIRSYGVPKMEDDVYFEIKNKYKGIVGKRRIKIKLQEFYDYMENNVYDSNNQIMKELDYLIEYYDLKPKMYIAYDRKSYKGKEDHNLRITIDSNLRSRDNHLRLDYGDKGEKYFEEEYYIMEIKTLGSLPLWLVKSLSRLKIYPTSFSKYGSIYKKHFKGDDISVR